LQFLRIHLQTAGARGQALRRFYRDQLGLPTVSDGATWHAFKAGPTVIEFGPVSDGQPFYHFALRVPRNRFATAREWLAQSAELLPDEDSGETTFDLDNWNAVACYAHDPCGNIVELIAHNELPEVTPNGQSFRAGELLGVCELGVVGPDVRAMAHALEPLGIGLWDGEIDEPGRLAFMGDRDGVLILSPDGRGWLPTRRPAEMDAVEAVVAGARNAQATLPGTPHHVRTTT
jgi:catechol 2,3-dioxygenase-like lactoylglutathione lyase family enzyme